MAGKGGVNRQKGGEWERVREPPLPRKKLLEKGGSSKKDTVEPGAKEGPFQQQHGGPRGMPLFREKSYDVTEITATNS